MRSATVCQDARPKGAQNALALSFELSPSMYSGEGGNASDTCDEVREGAVSRVLVSPHHASSSTDISLPTRKSSVSSESNSSHSGDFEARGNINYFDLRKNMKEDTKARTFSAIRYLGEDAIVEARKGLSRVIRTGVPDDVEEFASQLKSENEKKRWKACASNYTNFRDDDVLCVALSYVHQPKDKCVERFKFSTEQWGNFKNMMATLAQNGVEKIRIWLDQCLWIRDASQPSWVHIGLVPYVLWPVLSLGTKKVGGERTLPTYDRVWPFMEELAGLWSLGVFITRERRNTETEDSRVWISHNQRHCCEPEVSMIIMLLNVFHGALDSLHTGWTKDRDELQDMAKWNILSDTEELMVGPKWKEMLSAKTSRPVEDMFKCISIPMGQNNELAVYLEATRKLEDIKSSGWHGLHEWMSGNTTKIWAISGKECESLQALDEQLYKLNVKSDEGEFQMLKYGMRPGFAIWLLVCMDGKSANCCHGRVSWTKVMHGKNTLLLDRHVENTTQMGTAESGVLNNLVVTDALSQQVGKAVTVTETRRWKNPIDWDRGKENS